MMTLSLVVQAENKIFDTFDFTEITWQPNIGLLRVGPQDCHF